MGENFLHGCAIASSKALVDLGGNTPWKKREKNEQPFTYIRYTPLELHFIPSGRSKARLKKWGFHTHVDKNGQACFKDPQHDSESQRMFALRVW
uniref:hypothetical protein n=1 Tax=Hassallia byssoidea TaxID=482630 RepID=UPI000584A2B9|nr:hypothetical protein [Hassalia byssoidea]